MFTPVPDCSWVILGTAIVRRERQTEIMYGGEVLCFCLLKPELGDTTIFFGFVLVSCAHEAYTLEDYQETNREVAQSYSIGLFNCRITILGRS